MKSRDDDYYFRFGGIARLYGIAALDRLHQSRVAVIGIGGVGSWAAEALARSAVGHISLFDMDDICVSNINRQLPAMDGSVGRLKVEEMAARIRLINPYGHCEAIAEFVTAKNIEAQLLNKFDLVVDATDSFNAKIAIILFCKRHKIPLVCSGAAGGQIDPTQIQVTDLSKTIQDPLLSKIRTTLRQKHHFSRNPKRKFGIPAVFSTEQPVFPQSDGTVCATRDTSPNSPATGPVKLDCSSGFGASTCVTASFGMVAASTAIQRLIIPKD
jgi:tRNA A37 threonylcarbamoyladenosine dehydratase